MFRWEKVRFSWDSYNELGRERPGLQRPDRDDRWVRGLTADDAVFSQLGGLFRGRDRRRSHLHRIRQLRAADRDRRPEPGAARTSPCIAAGSRLRHGRARPFWSNAPDDLGYWVAENYGAGQSWGSISAPSRYSRSESDLFGFLLSTGTSRASSGTAPTTFGGCAAMTCPSPWKSLRSLT